MNWYLEALKKYAVFKGRARRKEYWIFTLGTSAIIYAFLAFIYTAQNETSLGVLLFIYFVLVVAVFLPHLAVTVRRLHDIGESGWKFLISFIPIVGGILLLIMLASDGTHGPNQYGPDPKQLEE